MRGDGQGCDQVFPSLCLSLRVPFFSQGFIIHLNTALSLSQHLPPNQSYSLPFKPAFPPGFSFSGRVLCTHHLPCRRAQPPSIFPLCPSHSVSKSCWFKSHVPFVSTVFFSFPWQAYPLCLPSCITEMIFWACVGGGRRKILGCIGVGGRRCLLDYNIFLSSSFHICCSSLNIP